jgi:hypothetical protein
MAIDKSTWNKKVKVSQSTIDDIKRLGMSKALRLAKENAGAKQAGLVKEYQEATRRLYGDRRFAAATAGAAKKPSTSYSPAPKKASTSYSPQKMKSAPKKTGGISDTSKRVAGGVAAVALTVASRGRLAGMAAKLSPALMKNKAAQALLTGEIKKAAPKAVSQSQYKTMIAAKSGQRAAAKGRDVTPEQYSAMSAAAKAAAKKAVPKKTAAKKVAAKKDKAMAARAPKVSRWDANAPKPRAPKKTK